MDTYYGQVQPRLGVAYAVSPEMALSGGYSLSNRPALAYADGENFVTPNSTGYNASISITRATRPTPNSQDPVMQLSEPYPTFTGSFPNYDPTQLNNQGVGTVLRGDEARRERYNNYNVTLRRQLPESFSTTVAYIGAYGTRLPFMPLDLGTGNEINRIPFDAIGRYGDLLLSPLSSQPQLGIALPYAGFTGTVLDALRPYPQFTSITWQNSFKGKTRYNSLQTSLERHFKNDFAAARRLHVVQDRRQRAHAGWVGRRVGDSGGGRHFPHFLKLTWIYELPIGPGKAINVDGVLGQIVGGWTITGIHNYRSGGTLSVSDSRINGAGYPIPSRCRVGRRSHHLRWLGRRSRARHALSEPGGVRDAAVVGAGHPDPDRHGAVDPRRARTGAYTEDLGFSSASAWASAASSSESTSSTCSIARAWAARTPTCRARTSARSSASVRARGGCSCRSGRRSS